MSTFMDPAPASISQGGDGGDSAELEKACAHACELLDAFLKGERRIQSQGVRPMVGFG